MVPDDPAGSQAPFAYNRSNPQVPLSQHAVPEIFSHAGIIG
jgi:hypothetical protein